jgi:hypothetical protein
MAKFCSKKKNKTKNTKPKFQNTHTNVFFPSICDVATLVSNHYKNIWLQIKSSNRVSFWLTTRTYGKNLMMFFFKELKSGKFRSIKKKNKITLLILETLSIWKANKGVEHHHHIRSLKIPLHIGKLFETKKKKNTQKKR